jgi:hypothetical protein
MMRTPSATESLARRAELDVQMKEFQHAYETSTGFARRRFLLAALMACKPLEPGPDNPGYRVPAWLYEALCEQERARLRQEHGRHWMRWFMVCDARYRKGLTWPAAYKDASEALKGKSDKGTPRTMRESYRIVVRRNRRR